MKKFVSKKLTLAILLLVGISVLVSGCGFAKKDTINITGVVVDANSKPIAEITLSIIDSDATVKTNKDGKFTFTNVKEGRNVLALIGNKGTGKIVVNAVKNMKSLTITYPIMTEIVIFHVNDTHSKLNNFPKLSWIVKDARDNYDNVFLLSAGDMFSGSPIVDQYDPKGYPMIDLMNKVGFDVMTLGNHDFDYGQGVLKDRMADAEFPMICANLEVTTDNLPQPEPYAFLTTENELKIAVLGLVQISSTTGIPATHPDNVVGINFTDGLTVAEEYLDLADDSNLFIALSHLGSSTDSDLANQMGEMDLIIGGHSHTVIEEPVLTNGVAIVQAGDDLTYLGKIIVTMENGHVANIDGELITLNEESPNIDQEIQKLVDDYNSDDSFNRVIGIATSAIDSQEELGCLMTDAMTEIHDLDIAFQNSGGIRVSSLEGEITVSDIYALEPFGNEIIRYELSVDEIEALLMKANRNFTDLFVSGIKYMVLTEWGEVKDVVLTDYAGNPIDETRTYSVGLNSFIASSATYDFEHDDPGVSTYSTMAETIIEYIDNGGNLDYDGVVRTGRSSNNVVGQTDVILSSADCYNGSNTAGNLIADAIRVYTGADIALFPSGNLNGSAVDIPVGSINEGDLLQLYSSYINSNEYVVADILGSDLKQLIYERSARNKNADIQVSGMTYVINFDDTGDLADVECYLENGNVIADDETYTVSFNDYYYDSYYGVSGKVTNEVVGETTEQEMLLDYMLDLDSPLPVSLAEERVTIATNIIGQTDVTLSAKDCYNGSNTAGNLMTDAIRAHTDAQIVTFPSSYLNSSADDIQAGSINQTALLQLYGSYIGSNKAVVAEIKGSDLKQFFFDRSDRYNNADVQVSGMTYVIQLEAGNLSSVECYLENGDPIVDDEVYTVSFNDYNYNNYYGLADKVISENVSDSSEQSMLLDYIINLTEPIPGSLAEERITIQ